MNRILKLSSALLVFTMLLASTALAKSDLAYAAVAGTVTLTGGESGTHYSDKQGFNIVTISVSDTDVSAERSGVARFTVASTTAQNVDGHTTFPLDGTNVPSGGTANTGAVAAILQGEAEQVDTFTATAGQTVFTLTKPGRDANNDAQLGVTDVVVTINGVTTAAASVQTTKTDGSGGGNNGANGATRITTVTMAAATVGDVYVITYETSEYDQATPANTPFLTGVSDMSINVGGTGSIDGNTVYDPTAATPVGLIDPSTGIIQATAKLDYNVVKISFKYEVTDTLTDKIKVSTPTSTALNKDRTLTATESGAATDAYTTTVALFSSADYAIIEKEVNRASCDAGGNDGATPTEVHACLDTATGAQTLGTRWLAARAALGIADSAGNSPILLARIVPVADGETLTVAYTDASPAATVSATATMDMTAPTITLVQPTSATSTNNTTPTLEVQVTDTGAGVTSSTIDLALGDVDKNAVASPITNGFRITFVPSSELAEASYEWNVITNGQVAQDITDDVGNTPATTVAGTVTTPFTFNVDKTAATLSSAVTGTGEASRATDADGVVTVTEGANSSAVKITFDDGDGNAKIDAASIAVSDITIGGTNPASVTVNDNIVYAVMATALDSAATPKVEISGSISDAAGNATTTGDVTATDGIVPTITISTDVSVTKEKVTITVTSSENLLVAPEIYVATIGAGSLTATATSSTVYTATATTTTSEVHTISVNAVDIASNNVRVQVTQEDISAAVRTAADAESDDVLDVATVITLPKGNIVDSTGDGQITVADVKTGCGTTLAGAKNDTAQEVTSLVATTGAIKLHADQVTAANTCLTATAAHSWVATYAYTASTATFEGDVALAAPTLKPNADTDDTSPHIIIDFSAEATEYTSDANSAVTISKATLDGVDITGDLQTSDNGKFVYLASGLAVGEHTIVVNAADTAGNVLATDASQTFNVVAEAETSIALSPGMNLISFSGATKSTAFSDVFSNSTINSVLTYDPSVPGNWLSATLNSATGKLEGPLAERAVDEDLAYWVDSSSYDPIKVVIPSIGFGAQTLPPSIDVVKGYNYVAIATISGASTVQSETYFSTITWTRGYVFNATTQAYTTITKGSDVALNVGDGVIIYASAAGVIVP